MARKQKQHERFWGEPTPKDYSWGELRSLVTGVYGYMEKQGSGCRVKFYDPEKKLPQLRFHKPHPGNIVKQRYLEQVRETLAPYKSLLNSYAEGQ